MMADWFKENPFSKTDYEFLAKSDSHITLRQDGTLIAIERHTLFDNTITILILIEQSKAASHGNMYKAVNAYDKEFSKILLHDGFGNSHSMGQVFQNLKTLGMIRVDTHWCESCRNHYDTAILTQFGTDLLNFVREN
jgi:hypothetical protein